MKRTARNNFVECACGCDVCIRVVRNGNRAYFDYPAVKHGGRLFATDVCAREYERKNGGKNERHT